MQLFGRNRAGIVGNRKGAGGVGEELHAEPQVECLAGSAAIAIENAQLNEAVRRHADELEERVIERTAELERERKRTAAILDTAGEGIIFTDASGTIEYINPAMERLTGYLAAEVSGRNPRLWADGLDRPIGAADVLSIFSPIASGKINVEEARNLQGDETR